MGDHEQPDSASSSVSQAPMHRRDFWIGTVFISLLTGGLAFLGSCVAISQQSADVDRQIRAQFQQAQEDANRERKYDSLDAFSGSLLSAEELQSTALSVLMENGDTMAVANQLEASNVAITNANSAVSIYAPDLSMQAAHLTDLYTRLNGDLIDALRRVDASGADSFKARKDQYVQQCRIPFGLLTSVSIGSGTSPDQVSFEGCEAITVPS